MTETKKAAFRYCVSSIEWGPGESYLYKAEIARKAFLAGAAYERERAKGLEKAIEDIMSALFLECQPDKGHIFGRCDDIALPALSKWRQHDQNKSRDGQAMDFADSFYNRTLEPDEFETCVMAWQEGYNVGFDAAEKQYLGEIEPLKAELADRLEQAKKWHSKARDYEVELESAVEVMSTVKLRLREIAFAEDGSPIIGTSNRFAKKNYEIALKDVRIAYGEIKQTLTTLKSKLGRGEKPEKLKAIEQAIKDQDGKVIR